MPVAGLRGTGDFGTDERPKDFREGILWYNPNGESPIFALTAKAGKRKVKDPEFAWWHEGNTIIRLQVNGALGSGDTLITVDSPDPTVSTLGANFGLATHLKPGDLLWVEPTADAAAYTQELIEVTNVLSDTQFQARRGAAGTSAAAIANDQWMTVIGSAYAEGTSVPRPTSRNPLKFYNYTQIFKDSYELTKTLDATKGIRTGDPWSNDKKRKSFKHSADIEMAILMGRRSETTGENGKPKRTFGGLRTFIPSANTTVFSSAVTINSFLAAVAPLFDYSTGAGDSRIMFVGNGAALELAKIFNAATNVQLTHKEGVNVYRMHFQEFIIPNGRLLIKTHPLMSRNTILNKAAFILDFDAIKWCYLEGRDTKAFDDVQAADEDVRRGYWQTEGSLEVGYGGLTMGYLGNISAT